MNNILIMYSILDELIMIFFTCKDGIRKLYGGGGLMQ
jgi:hypothetical protein